MGEGARGRERGGGEQAHWVPCDTRRRMHSSRVSDWRMGQLSMRGLLGHRGETTRVTLVSTAVVRMGEGVCVDGGEWTRLTGYNAIDGRTKAVSSTDGGWVR